MLSKNQRFKALGWHTLKRQHSGLVGLCCFIAASFSQGGLAAQVVAGKSSSHADQVQDVQLKTSNQVRRSQADLLLPEMAEKMENTAETLFQPPSAVRRRVEREVQLAENPLAFLPYKANYLLPVSYYSGYRQSSGSRGQTYGSTEIQFQISLKFPLDTGLFTRRDALMVAYTQQSYWQAYEESAPFRETIYEPELIYGVSLNRQLFSELSLEGFALGVNHQSNGQGGAFSRSWNRLFAEVFFASGDWGFALKRWYRIPEQASEDDNPNITDFVGVSELGMAYSKAGHVATFRLRNHIDSDFSRGNMQFSWSFPLSGERYKGYLLLRSGYGDTLADYDVYTNRVGLGISINDIL